MNVTCPREQLRGLVDAILLRCEDWWRGQRVQHQAGAAAAEAAAVVAEVGAGHGADAEADQEPGLRVRGLPRRVEAVHAAGLGHGRGAAAPGDAPRPLVPRPRPRPRPRAHAAAEQHVCAEHGLGVGGGRGDAGSCNTATRHYKLSVLPLLSAPGPDSTNF